jgi:hypothetical protein
MGAFCDSSLGLKLGSTAALDCRTGQNKGIYCKKVLLLILVSLIWGIPGWLLTWLLQVVIQAGTFFCFEITVDNLKSL